MEKNTYSNLPFNNYTKEYEEWFIRNQNIFLSEVSLLKQLIPDTRNCLEIGVGTGRFAEALHIKKGIDISSEMLKYAKKRGVDTYLLDAHKTSFSDKTFDCLLIVTIICFLDNPYLALKEAYRILTDKSILIVAFIDKDSVLGMKYQKNKNTNKFYKNASFYSTAEIISFLERSGFQINETKQTLFGNEQNLVEISKNGFGEGSFIGIKAQKQK